ncbi:hypothetical protein QCA50_003570 [Cerrena zonata]|uniref:Uncharacterized protein n=1 Tax=Cerrena zonata TaxID=2478898 RepID=A0AAW0GSJ2_9APHY
MMVHPEVVALVRVAETLSFVRLRPVHAVVGNRAVVEEEVEVIAVVDEDLDLGTHPDSVVPRCIKFGSEFDIRDSRLDVIRTRPAVSSRLEQLLLGDPETGKGGQLSGEGVLNLVNACPNLVVVWLDSTTQLTDAALQGICQACPKLESLRITGHDKSSGSIRGSSMKFLAEHPEVAPKLKQLILYDQSYYNTEFQKALKKLSTTRKRLAITTGETCSSSWRDTSSTSVTLNGKLIYDQGGW